MAGRPAALLSAALLLVCELCVARWGLRVEWPPWARHYHLLHLACRHTIVCASVRQCWFLTLACVLQRAGGCTHCVRPEALLWALGAVAE